ncbi:NUDIX hydrolase [Alkalicella caledoniensis]|nr:NUDIX domain-containing protein [Alkalicella caledoniensis]
MLHRIITDFDVIGGSKDLLERVDRYGARGVLLDENKKIALMYMKKVDLFKLPGGGIEEDENSEVAFLREIQEETGFECEIIEELGIVEEHKNINKFLQLSYCFLASKLPSDQNQSLSKNEQELGFELQWFELDHALRLLRQSFKKCEDYSMKFMMLRDATILEYTIKSSTRVN